MGLHGKIEADVEMKASATEFHEMMKTRLHHVTNACPDRIQACNLLQGGWGIKGSIISWNYVLDGKPAVAKEIIERIDDEKNLITFKVIGGDIMEDYKTFKATLQVTPNGDESVAHWTLEYEKKHENVPEAHNVLQFFGSACKAVDSYIV